MKDPTTTVTTGGSRRTGSRRHLVGRLPEDPASRRDRHGQIDDQRFSLHYRRSEGNRIGAQRGPVTAPERDAFRRIPEYQRDQSLLGETFRMSACLTE